MNKTLNIIVFILLLYPLLKAIPDVNQIILTDPYLNENLLLNMLALSPSGKHLTDYPSLISFSFKIVAIVFIMSYLIEDVKNFKSSKKISHILRILIIVYISFWVFFIPTYNSILLRHYSQKPWTNCHDGCVLQTELAIEKLLNLENPYGNFYPDMLKWWGQNPGAWHYVYSPFPLYFLTPFYLISKSIFGFFDTRMIYIICYYLTGLIILLMKLDRDKKIFFMILYYMNYEYIVWSVLGYCENFLLFWLVLTLFFILRKNYLISGITLGLTLGTKSTSMILLPFYILFILLQKNIKIPSKIANKFTPLKYKLLLAATPITVVILIFAPFIISNPYALYDDLILYVTGPTEHLYPMFTGRRATISVYPLWNNLVNSMWDYYPMSHFHIITFCSFIVLAYLQVRKNTVSTLLRNSAVLTFIFFTFSRVFQENYYIYLLNILILSFVIDKG